MKFRIFAVLAALALTPVAASANANLVSNGTFSDTSNYTFPGYFSGATSSYGWSGVQAGVSVNLGNNGGAAFWDNGYVPGGQGTSGYVGFVQGNGYLTTALSNLTVGNTYSLSFYANGRNYASPGYTSSFDVTAGTGVGVNNPVILASTLIPSVNATYVYDAAFQYFVATFTATSASENLYFNGNTANEAGDTSVLIAQVSVLDLTTPVPEPISLSLMAMGILGLGAARRRRG